MESQIKWILVKDKLPTKEESKSGIIVFDQQAGVHEADYYEGRFCYPYYGQDISGEYKDVIAWAELPLPPKTK